MIPEVWQKSKFPVELGRGRNDIGSYRFAICKRLKHRSSTGNSVESTVRASHALNYLDIRPLCLPSVTSKNVDVTYARIGDSFFLQIARTVHDQAIARI